MASTNRPYDKDDFYIDPSFEGYILYGSADDGMSYFTEKVRHGMIWYVGRRNFKEVQKGAISGGKKPSRDKKVEARAGTHQIPILETPERWMVADSTPILQLLNSRINTNHPLRKFYPDGIRGALAALLEEYFDEWFARLGVYTRWYYMKENSTKGLLKGAPEFAFKWGQRAADATCGRTEHQRKLGVEELKRVLSTFNNHLVQQKENGKGDGRFIFGNFPTAADCVIYGSCTAHFLRDVAPTRMLDGITDQLANALKQADTSIPMDDDTSRDHIPDFVHFILNEMGSNGYLDFARENAIACAMGERILKFGYHGEEASYLARTYPERSRLILKRFLKLHLATTCTEKEQNMFRDIMQKYRLFDVFHPDGQFYSGGGSGQTSKL